NFAIVAKEGRKPGLMLARRDGTISLRDWGLSLLDRILGYADLLDDSTQGNLHRQTVLAQRQKIEDPSLTPSATLLQRLSQEKTSLHDFTLRQSSQHRDTLLATPLPPAIEASFKKAAADSLRAQAQLEHSDTESFDDYVARYHAGLMRPATTA